MTLKVLKAEEWMKYSAMVALNMDDPPEEITPICNRDGIYYNSAINFCWFEAAGKAYMYDSEDVKRTLDILNHNPLRSCVRDAIIVLHKSDLASTDQLKLLQMDSLVHELRTIKLNAMKFHQKIRGTNANRRNNNRSSP